MEKGVWPWTMSLFLCFGCSDIQLNPGEPAIVPAGGVVFFNCNVPHCTKVWPNWSSFGHFDLGTAVVGKCSKKFDNALSDSVIQANTSDQPRAAVAYHFIASLVKSPNTSKKQKMMRCQKTHHQHTWCIRVIIAIIAIDLNITAIMIMIRWLQRLANSLFRTELITPRCWWTPLCSWWGWPECSPWSGWTCRWPEFLIIRAKLA